MYLKDKTEQNKLFRARSKQRASNVERILEPALKWA